MSFWPFSNSLSNSNQLHRYLDSIQDPGSIDADDFLKDPILVHELLNGLHNLKDNGNASSYPFLHQQEVPSNVSTSETSSVSREFSGSIKDIREKKLIEIFVQPQVLHKLLDYVVNSVDFFDRMKKRESEREASPEYRDAIGSETLLSEFDRTSGAEGIEVEEAENLENDSERNEEEERADDHMLRVIQAAAEILSSNFWFVLKSIVENLSLINKLWLFLADEKLEESSSPLLYCIHILDQLLESTSNEFLNFVRQQENLVDTFLLKLETPTVTDFFLRIIQTDKVDSPTGIIEVLSLQGLVPKLVEILKPDPSQFAPSSVIANYELYFRQSAATEFLKAFVGISSHRSLALIVETNIGPNQLTRELVSPEIMTTIVEDIMLYKYKDPNTGILETNKHGISNCVGIIIEIIRKNNSDYDFDCTGYKYPLPNGEDGVAEVSPMVMYQWLRDFEKNPPGPRNPIYLGYMLSLFSKHLNEFMELIRLNDCAAKKQGRHSLGVTNLKISELFAELLHCSNMVLLNSKRIDAIIRIRDKLRIKQNDRLKNALNETFLSSDKITDESHASNDISGKLENASLHETSTKSPSAAESLEEKYSFSEDEDVERETNEMSAMFKGLDMKSNEESDEDEQSISSENPFVTTSRDKSLRANPCIGDAFKIELSDLGFLSCVVRKFVEYPLNNFFHNVVFDIVQQIFNGKLKSYNSFLIVDLFRRDRCNITEVIIKSIRQNSKGPHAGYMGHLILMSEEIVKFTSLYKPDLISPIIVDRISSDDWNWYVNDVLLKTREVYNTVLGTEELDEDLELKNTLENKDDTALDFGPVGYLEFDDDGDDDSGTKDMRDRNLASYDHVNDEDNIQETPVPEVNVHAFPLLRDIDRHDRPPNYDEGDHYNQSYQDDLIDNISGSSSSDEEDDFFEGGDDSNDKFHFDNRAYL